jgi:hypothetical protein
MNTDDVTTGTGNDDTGQDNLDPITGQPEVSPDVTTDGQSADQTAAGTTDDKGTQATAEDTFFNPEDIKGKPELEKAYKQMQSSYTKKMQEISEGKQKIDAYDAFRADPVSNVQAMAKQLGFTISKAEAQHQVDQAQANQDFQPDSWEQVFGAMGDRMKPMLEQMFEQRFGPVVNQVQAMKKESIESFLDENAPDWRQYEDNMKATLQQHPTLANDPKTLYELSIPPEVRTSRATKAALQKMQNKVESNKTAGISTTKAGSDVDMPSGTMTWEQSIDWARKKLAAEGKGMH